MTAEQEINNLALIYEELQRKGKLDKEGVAYALGLTITDWNLRKCIGLMKRVAEEFTDVKLEKASKGKYILVLEGWEELKREREKRLFDGERYVQDLLSIVYNGNKIEIREFQELVTLYQLKYVSEVISARNSLTGGRRWYMFRLGGSLHVFFINNKEGKYLIYDFIDSKKILDDLYNINQKYAKEKYKIIRDYQRQLQIEKQRNMKIIEKLKETGESSCIQAIKDKLKKHAHNK